MAVQSFPLHWQVGPTSSPEIEPHEFVPAEVPGAVQLDWARAHDIPLPEYSGNTGDYRWMEDSFWLYRTKLDLSAVATNETAFFVCNGVDYNYQVRLAGVVMREYEGMFTPFQIALDPTLHHNTVLEILIHPAPKSHHNGDDRVQANRSAKPAVSYGWDFHPRLIPLGIWDHTAVEIRPALHIRYAETTYELNDDLTSAHVSIDLELSRPPAAATVRWQLLDPDGTAVIEQTIAGVLTAHRLSAYLESPRLWWPNGQGDQPLYTSRVELLDPAGRSCDRSEHHVGFRKIKLIRTPPVWDPTADEFPRGPLIAPIIFEVNNRQIFAKGSNWVSPDIFPGRITAETYRPLLQMARDAHMNILRCWGGAIVQKEAFFEQCDELGLMVWQEFPLSCNYYEGRDYLPVLDLESRAIILRLRRHPSVVLWCGGNELFNTWSGGGMSEQDHAIRLLNRNTYDLDPSRPFMNTSPLYGMGHGFYLFSLPDGTELYQYLPQRSFAAYSEFGVPAPSHADILRRIIPPAEIFPPRPSPAWVARHAYDAWDGSKGSWLEYDFLVRYYGEFENLEEMVEAGQLVQAEGLRFFFEETRRQKPTCSLVMNWCLNEPWPAAANSSLIAWPDRAKPAMGTVGLACRPVLASARPAKLRWLPGETFSADLFLLNDSHATLPAGKLEAALILDGARVPVLTWDHPAGKANANLSGPQLRYELPRLEAKRFELHLRHDQQPEWESTYTFLMG
jgi:beta-mannosidase